MQGVSDYWGWLANTTAKCLSKFTACSIISFPTTLQFNQWCPNRSKNITYLAPGWFVEDWFCISNFLFSLSSSARIATLFLFWKPGENDRKILERFTQFLWPNSNFVELNISVQYDIMMNTLIFKALLPFRTPLIRRFNFPLFILQPEIDSLSYQTY